MRDSEKQFLRRIESKVESTIKKYNLLNKKEKILVAASGGKDSTAVMHILEKLGYNISALTIDVQIGAYTKTSVKNLKEFCKKEKIPLYVIDVRDEFGCSICYMKSALNSKGIKLNSCAVCGVVKRYLINKAAKELKAKKLVTGHNMDDEAQAIMMNFFRNTLQLSARLGPESGVSKSAHFVQRVKPLYFVSEKDIVKYSKIMKFPVNYGQCPCASVVYRNFVRTLLDEYEKTNPQAKQNIIDYFLKIQPELKQKFKAQKHSRCMICSEPSNGKVCRTCQLVGEIKKPKRFK